MSNRTQSFSVTGSTNSTVLDTGISSTNEETLFLKGVYISVSALQGNTVEGWISQTRHVQILDYPLRTHVASGTNQYPDTNGVHYLPIERELQVGETFQIGINSGGTATNIFGAYEFEVVGN